MVRPSLTICSKCRKILHVFSLAIAILDHRTLFVVSHLSKLRELHRANCLLGKTQRDQPKSGECQPKLINGKRPR